MLWKWSLFCRCQEHCAIGQWGPDCANKCTCQNRDNNCDAVTGRCTNGGASLVEQTSPVYLRSTTERVQTSRIGNAEYTEVVSAPRETTERQTEGEIIRLPKKVFVCVLRNYLPKDVEMALQAFNPSVNA